MKIITFIFILISTGLLAQDALESDDAQQQKVPTPAELKATEMNKEGDRLAVAGKREDALYTWSEALALAGPQTDCGREANDRLEWANRPEGWGPIDPGLTFSRSVRDRYLGTQQAQRRALVTEYFTNNDGTLEHFEAYSRWLLEMLETDHACELLPLAMEDGLDSQPRWLSQMIEALSSSQSFVNAPEKAIGLMQKLGFLNDAKTLSTIPLDEEAQSTLFAQMMRSLHSYHQDKKKLPALIQIMKLLQGKQPRTLGLELTLALLEKDEAKAISAFVLNHSAELLLIPEEHRREVIAAFKHNLDGYPNTDDMDDAVVAALRPLLPKDELKDDTLKDRIKEMLTSERGNNSHDDAIGTAESAAVIICKSSKHHLVKAIDCMKLAIAILQDSPQQHNPSNTLAYSPLSVLLNKLALEPDLFLEAISSADKAGILSSQDWAGTLGYNLGELVPDKSKFQRSDIVKLFASGRFVAEAEEFNPVLIDRNIHWTLLSNIFSKCSLGVKPSPIVKELLQYLQQRQPRTFGVELMELSLTKNTAGLDEFIRRRSADFAKIPPGHASAVYALMIEIPKTEYLGTDKFTPEQIKILKPLIENANSEIETFYERVMKAGSMTELGLAPHSCQEPARQAADFIAQYDVPKAMSLFHKIEQLISASSLKDYTKDSLERMITDWRLKAVTIPELYGSIEAEAVNKGQRYNVNDAFSNAGGWKKMERFVLFFRAAHLLDDAPEFSIQEGGHTRSSLFDIYNHFWICNHKMKPQILDFLDREPQTFGVELLKSVIIRQEPVSLNFVKKRAVEIMRMPWVQQKKILYVIGIEGGSWMLLAAASPEWKKALEPAMPLHQARVRTNCQKLMAATRPEDVGITDNNIHDWLCDISELILIEPEKGQAAYDHLMRMETTVVDAYNQSQDDLSTTWLKNISNFPVMAKFLFTEKKLPLNADDSRCDLFDSVGLIFFSRPLEFITFIEVAGFMDNADHYDATLSLPRLYWNMPDKNVAGDQGRRVVVQQRILTYIFNPETFHKDETCDSLKHLLEYVRQRQPRTFGSEFMRAMLEPDKAASVSAFLKTYQADIARLPEASRKQVLDLLRIAWPKMPEVK